MNYQTARHRLVNTYTDADGNVRLVAEIIIRKEDACEEFLKDVVDFYDDAALSDACPFLYELQLNEEGISIHKSIKPNRPIEEAHDWIKLK